MITDDFSDASTVLASQSEYEAHPPATPSRSDAPALRPLVEVDAFPPELVDSLRYVVGRVQLGADGDLPSRFAVVSALHGEGVTTISRTLAAVIAQDLELRVCWVDLSAAGGSPVERDPKPRHPGLHEVLTFQMELSEALQETDSPRLLLLPAGNVAGSQRNAAVVRGREIAALLDELDQRFDCLILDVPPLLAASAGLALVRHASSYLLVVRQGVTTVKQVRTVAAQLKSMTSLGAVLNQYRSRVPKWLAELIIK